MKLPDFTTRRADVSPEETALVDTGTGRGWSYAQLDERASRAAIALRAVCRVEPGDRIAVIAHNTTDTLELLFACAKLGAILVPLNWRLAVDELAAILADAEPIVLVSDTALAAQADELAAKFPLLTTVRYGADPAGVVHAYEALLAEAGNAPVSRSQLPDDEPWYLLYTSGTTGRPKGVIQTHGMALVNYLNIGIAVGLTAADTTLNLLPLFHAGGMGLFTLPTLYVGGTAIVQRTVEPAETLRLLTERTTVFFGVPTVYQLLLDHPDFGEADLSRVRSWASGGAAMPLPLLHRLADHGIVVRQGMGMTETGPTTFLIDTEHALTKAGSVGKAQTFVEVKIVDRAGRTVPTGESGELMIRGPGVTPGYWRRPDATAEAFDADGWLHSGDVARRDEDGYYYIVDRWKDMYISGGENVYPAEVEQVLHSHPQIADAAVVGVPDERWGETGRAYVVLAQPSVAADSATQVAPLASPEEPTGDLVADVLTYCRARLAGYKVPREVLIVPELPRNASGKILKHELRRGGSEVEG